MAGRRPRDRRRTRRPRPRWPWPARIGGWSVSVLLHAALLAAAAFVLYAVRWSDAAARDDDGELVLHFPEAAPTPASPWQRWRSSWDEPNAVNGWGDAEGVRHQGAADALSGREDAVADSEMGGDGGFMTTAAGGGACGMFGCGHDDITYEPLRLVVRSTGHARSDETLRRGVAWLLRVQRPDGRWTRDGGDAGESDPTATALALWCLHRGWIGSDGPHAGTRRALDRGVAALLADQREDGTLAAWPAHALAATLLAAEAWNAEPGTPRRAAADRALDAILVRQERTAGDEPLAWRGAGEAIDTWTSMWCALALIQDAGDRRDDLAAARRGIRGWLRRVSADSEVHEPVAGDHVPFPLTWSAEGTAADRRPVPGMAAVAAMTLPAVRGDNPLPTLLASGIDIVGDDDPAICWSTTLAAWSAADWRWDLRRRTLPQRLARGQSGDGSWWARGSVVDVGGRVGTTALICLTLAVFDSDEARLAHAGLYRAVVEPTP